MKLFSLHNFIVIFLAFMINCALAAGPNWPILDNPKNWVIEPKSYILSVDSSRTFSDGNYNRSGNAVNPDGFDDISNYNTRLHGGLSLQPGISLFFQSSISHIYLNTPPTSPTVTQNITGLGDGFLALRYLLYVADPPPDISPKDHNYFEKGWHIITEATWNFPMYADVPANQLPQGDASNDFTLMLRSAYFFTKFFAPSFAIGYTYRMAGYASEIPMEGRADIYSKLFHFWAHAKGNLSLRNDSMAATTNPDTQVPGGSYLFKTINAETLLTGGGIAYILSKNWELAASYDQTLFGINSAKFNSIALGLAYRPKIEPEEQQIVQEPPFTVQQETNEVAAPETRFLTYTFSTPILKVSDRGNFFKIGKGSLDGVRVNDEFHIFSVKSPTHSEKLIATAEVISVRKREAFLRIRELHIPEAEIVNGDEARRVMYEEPNVE